jgi:hypothetical protein
MRYSRKIKAISVSLKNDVDKNKNMDYINNMKFHSSVPSWVPLLLSSKSKKAKRD